jgi:hypothetical protein
MIPTSERIVQAEAKVTEKLDKSDLKIQQMPANF